MGDHSPSPTPSPSPIVYSPSQEFIGNDGQWSTFVVRVGSPAQNFHVIPASKSSEIYVPIVDGCQRDNITSCGPLRGAYDFNGRESSGFLVNSSSTWHEIGLYEMDARPELDFTANALYGLDTLGLMLQNSGGPTLSNQVIAAMANPSIWVGMVGLGQKPANFSEFDNPQEGLIGSLKKEGKIQSRSYGYTAGAWYSKFSNLLALGNMHAGRDNADRVPERPQALASLTLGGYDQSKFDQNKVIFDFDPDDDKPLSLNVQSMVAQNTFNGSTNLLGVVNQPMYVTIDYTVPHLWLPRSVCDSKQAIFFLLHVEMLTECGSLRIGIPPNLRQQHRSIYRQRHSTQTAQSEESKHNNWLWKDGRSSGKGEHRVAIRRFRPAGYASDLSQRNELFPDQAGTERVNVYVWENANAGSIPESRLRTKSLLDPSDIVPEHECKAEYCSVA